MSIQVNKSKVDNSDIENLFKIMLVDNIELTDSMDLYNLLGRDAFIKLTSFFNGKRIRTLKKKQLNEIMRTALLFYELEVEGLSWKEIKKKYPDLKLNINSERHRLAQLEKSIKEKYIKVVTSNEE